MLTIELVCFGSVFGRGTVMFPSATIGRGVHSMVIACVLGSKCETWMIYYRQGVCRAEL